MGWFKCVLYTDHGFYWVKNGSQFRNGKHDEDWKKTESNDDLWKSGIDETKNHWYFAADETFLDAWKRISMPTFGNLKDMNTVSSANEMKLQFSPKNWGHFPSFLDFPRLWDFQLSSKSHVFRILYIPWYPLASFFRRLIRNWFARKGVITNRYPLVLGMNDLT